MLETTYKRAEKIMVIMIIVGIVMMFRPWFSDFVELFEGLGADPNLGRTYRQEIAPIIFRYGFYAILLGAGTFISLSHYSVDDLVQALKEKGTLLTSFLIALPILYGVSVISNWAWDSPSGAILNVINFICAIAVWNRRIWGVVGLGLSALYGLILGFGPAAPLGMASFTFLLGLILSLLLWVYQPELILPLLERPRLLWANLRIGLGAKFRAKFVSPPPTPPSPAIAELHCSSAIAEAGPGPEAIAPAKKTAIRLKSFPPGYIILLIFICLIILVLVYLRYHRN